MVQRKSIVTCIILSIVTCGIYALYWLYCISTDVYKLSGSTNGSPAMDLVLSLVTCNIYHIYLHYKWGKELAAARREHGLFVKDDSVLYLVLCIFGLSLVAYAIIQNELNNEFGDAAGGGNVKYY